MRVSAAEQTEQGCTERACQSTLCSWRIPSTDELATVRCRARGLYQLRQPSGQHRPRETACMYTIKNSAHKTHTCKKLGEPRPTKGCCCSRSDGTQGRQKVISGGWGGHREKLVHGWDANNIYMYIFIYILYCYTMVFPHALGASQGGVYITIMF